MTADKGRFNVAALMKERRKETEERIAEYFKEHPFDSGIEAARQLCISRETVYRYIRKQKAKGKK